MTTTSSVRTMRSPFKRGLWMNDLDPKDDLRRQDWLVAPVHHPTWYLFDPEFAWVDVAVQHYRPNGYRYTLPEAEICTSSVEIDAIGTDGDTIEMLWNDRSFVFELDDDAAVTPGHILVDISGSASDEDTAEALFNCMCEAFGQARYEFGASTHKGQAQYRVGLMDNEDDPAERTVLRFFGPRILEVAYNIALLPFINVWRGKSEKAWRDVSLGKANAYGDLLNIKPPSGFPTVCIGFNFEGYPQEPQDEEFHAEIRIVGIDCTLIEREESIRVEFTEDGLVRYWGKVAWREIYYVEVVNVDFDTPADCELSIGWDLNYTITKAIQLTLTGLGGDGDTVTIDDGVNPPVIFENDIANNGVAGGNVAFGVGAATPADLALSLATVIQGEIGVSLRADLIVSSTYALHIGTPNDAYVYLTTPDRDDTLTITISNNVNGPTFVPNDNIWFDTPAEDDDWRLGFPHPFVVSEEEWGGVPHVNNVDGANFIEINSWDWNIDSDLRNRGNPMLTGTVAIPGIKSQCGGRVGQNVNTPQPSFDQGEFDLGAAVQNERDLNRWKPPAYFQPLVSAGTTLSDPQNFTQYRMYIFHLHDREKHRPPHHGDGQ